MRNYINPFLTPPPPKVMEYRNALLHYFTGSTVGYLLKVVKELHSNLTVNTALQCTVMKTTLTSVGSAILHFIYTTSEGQISCTPTSFNPFTFQTY